MAMRRCLSVSKHFNTCQALLSAVQSTARLLLVNHFIAALWQTACIGFGPGFSRLRVFARLARRPFSWGPLFLPAPVSRSCAFILRYMFVTGDRSSLLSLVRWGRKQGTRWEAWAARASRTGEMLLGDAWSAVGLSPKVDVLSQRLWCMSQAYNMRPEQQSIYYRYATSLHWSLTQFTPATASWYTSDGVE